LVQSERLGPSVPSEPLGLWVPSWPSQRRAHPVRQEHRVDLAGLVGLVGQEHPADREHRAHLL
jgi:hypothetical protein